MKVLVVNNMAPFVWGGAEELATHLQRNLHIFGHEAEILRIPFQWEPATGIPSQMMLARSIELSNVDHVIALKFPAYLIRHSNKTFWLLHQYRQAYDLYDAGQSNLPSDQLGLDIRELIRNADNQSFAEAKNIFTNSEVTRKRLFKYNGFDSTVLLPPVNDPEIFHGGKSQGYIFSGGRVNDMKRQFLLIEAMRFTNSGVNLLVAGPPDRPEDATRLRNLLEKYGLADRVRLDLRFLPRETYAGYINASSAVAYLPFDEDSLGYVAMEAATAAKPLISTHDSGGILGLAKHCETGWVSEPSPEALAEVMNSVFDDESKSKELGANARMLWLSMNINWPQTVDALLR